MSQDALNQGLVGRRILVVEDDLIVAQVVITALRELGCEVAGPVVNATEVWESMSDFPADLVLMDIGIEGAQDGIDTADMIRRQFDVPVVFLTGASDPEMIDRAKRVSPLGYLIKPIKPAMLRSTVEVALWRDAMERRVREREHWFSATLQAIGDAVITVDAREQVTYLNSQAERMLGKTLSAVEGSLLVDLVRLRDERSNKSIDVFSVTADVHALLQPVTGAMPIAVDHTIAAITGERNARLGWVLTLRDVTERRRYEAEVLKLNMELMSQSVVDELTQLSNRRGLMVLGDQLLRSAARAHAPLTVFFIDLNGMKFINDRCGHEAGDQALRDTATILKSAFRNCDIVGRLGGDEFVVVTESDQVDHLQMRIADAVATHNQTSQRDYSVSLSVGAVVHRQTKAEATAVSFATLLADADNAMYRQKRALRNTRAG